MGKLRKAMRRLGVWWRTLWRHGMAKQISVGLRSTGTVDVDIEEEKTCGDTEWNLSNLSFEQAEFLRDELTDALRRAKERGMRDAPKVPKPGPYGEMK